jgi:hypothetical protein
MQWQKGIQSSTSFGQKNYWIHNNASHVLKNVVFPILRDDLVTRSIRYDQLLITYGNKLAVKYKHLHQHDMIRSRLRLLGRFWLTMKKFNKELEQFSSIYDPLYYDNCIKSVQEIAQLDKDSNIYKAPATASSLGTLLKQVGNLFITERIKIHDYKQKENAENFLKILQEDYGTTINKVVEETQAQKRRQKKIILPSMDDIKKLYNYLIQKRKTAYDQLKQEFVYQDWLNLAQSLYCFNYLTDVELAKSSGFLLKIFIKLIQILMKIRIQNYINRYHQRRKR